jgi:hypothetical protein
VPSGGAGDGTGAVHLTELMAFHATKNRTHDEVSRVGGAVVVYMCTCVQICTYSLLAIVRSELGQ